MENKIKIFLVIIIYCIYIIYLFINKNYSSIYWGLIGLIVGFILSRTIINN